MTVGVRVMVGETVAVGVWLGTGVLVEVARMGVFVGVREGVWSLLSLCACKNGGTVVVQIRIAVGGKVEVGVSVVWMMTVTLVVGARVPWKAIDVLVRELLY